MRPTVSLLVLDLANTAVFPAEPLALALNLPGVHVVHTLEHAATVLAHKPSPSYLVVDIGPRGLDILPTLDQLALECPPSVRVVVVGDINDLNFYRQLKARGVMEYFAHPVNVPEVAAVLQQQPEKLSAPILQPATGKKGTVIAFANAASGDGASTVALNVAYALATDCKKSTVIVDMDYQFGMTARHLDIHAPFGLHELVEHHGRGVDNTMLAKTLYTYGNALRVIAAPDGLRMMPVIHPDTVRDLIQVLQSQFDMVILDMPQMLAPWTAAALGKSDKIVVVAQQWLRSLTHLSRLISAWKEEGIDKGKLILALNRAGAKHREAITPQDFERVAGKRIQYSLANDIKSVVAAENQGKTVLELGTSPLERQLRDMARSLAGAPVQAGGMVIPPGAGKAGLKSILNKLQ